MTAIFVSGLFLYPVKGLGGIAVESAETTRRGFRHDRRFMVVDADGDFVTQRELPRMATIWTDLAGDALELATADRAPLRIEAEPRARATRPVRVWSAVVQAHGVGAEADAWLSDALDASVQLVYMPDGTERACNPAHAGDGAIVGFADGYPYLLANEGSLGDLNWRIVEGGGHAVPMNRFRANIVVKAAAWAEDGWRDFTIGACGFRAVKPCTRCEVTTTDQASGERRGPEPLRTLAGFRDSPDGVCFGVNLIPTALGRVRVGDALLPAT